MNELMDDDDKPTGKKQKQITDSTTPVLDNFSRDLNKLAEQGKLDPVIGRDREILRIAQILSYIKISYFQFVLLSVAKFVSN